MIWKPKQLNYYLPPSNPSAKFATAVLLGWFICLGISRAADETDYSELIRSLNDFRASVEHDFTAQSENFLSFSEGLEQRLLYPVYTTFTDYIESPADTTLDDSYRGIHATPDAYGLGPEWSEIGPYPERYERYLINLIGKTYDHTYTDFSGGLAPATWADYGYGSEGNNTPADNWTNRLGWIWQTLPSIFRKNNVAGMGFGTVKLASSTNNTSVNWGANTDLPQSLQYTYSPDQTIVSLLMRIAAEQHAFNQWASYGGLLANLPFDYDDQRRMTNLVRGSALQIPIFEQPMSDNVYPFSTVDGDRTGYGVSLAEYFRIRNLQTMLPLIDARDYLNEEDNLSVVYTDPVYYNLIDHWHDSSYLNAPDPAYNPDGLLTNLPLLYHESTLYPAAWQDSEIPPSLDQYAALQRAKIINRLTLLAYSVTNGLGTVTNDTPFSLSSTNDFSDSSTSFFSEAQLQDLSDSSSPIIDTLSNSVSELQDYISPHLIHTSSSASIPVEFHISGLDNFRFDVDLPELSQSDPNGRVLLFLSKILTWLYYIGYYFFIIIFVRRQYYQVLSAFGVRVITPPPEPPELVPLPRYEGDYEISPDSPLW